MFQLNSFKTHTVSISGNNARISGFYFKGDIASLDRMSCTRI